MSAFEEALNTYGRASQSFQAHTITGVELIKVMGDVFKAHAIEVEQARRVCCDLLECPKHGPAIEQRAASGERETVGMGGGTVGISGSDRRRDNPPVEPVRAGSNRESGVLENPVTRKAGVRSAARHPSEPSHPASSGTSSANEETK